MKRVLILDFDDAASLDEALTARGFDVTHSRSIDNALKTASEAPFDALLIALANDLGAGIDACRQLSRSVPSVPLIAVGPLSNVGAAAALLAAGAEEFIPAPAEVDEILALVARAASRRLAAVTPEVAPAPGIARAELGELVGSSDAVQEVYALIERVAARDCTVLITGETGTGKELVARTLHALSGRSGQFIAVNCAGIPDALLESELFGHAKGAFTDAKAPRAGLLAAACRGSLFLDEIGEMSGALQSKLLRALQERKLRPVGSDRELPFDARVLAATSRDLEAEIASGRFRADLFFRIDVIRLSLPPLRARHADVLVLAEYFIERCAARNDKPAPTLTSAVASRLLGYPWPGNVRELQNCIERVVILNRSGEINVEDLPDRIRRYRHSSVAAEPRGMLNLAEVERRHIRDVLDAVGGKKGEAARILGIDRKTLYRKIERYGLKDPQNGCDDHETGTVAVEAIETPKVAGR